MHRNIFLLVLTVVAILLAVVGCESQHNPVNSEPIVIHDTTTLYDTIPCDTCDTTPPDTVYLPCDTCDTTPPDTVYCDTCICDTTVTDSMVYSDCLVLGKGIRIGTLGEPSYFVTVSREKTHGHPIEFCLYVYRTEGVYTGVLSATHLKKDWPVVQVEVIINDSQTFIWDVGEKHQTKDLTF